MPLVLLLLPVFLAVVRWVFPVEGSGWVWGALAAAFVGIFLYWVYALPKRGVTFVRGRRRPVEARDSEAHRQPGETVFWGGEELPAASATTHFLVAGTTGSGKTVLLNGLMASVLPFIGKRRADGSHFDRRALVYDAKGDVLSTLPRLTDARIVTLHPFDQRGASWDMACDVTTPAAALQVATLLVPQDRHAAGNPFFILAAQNLMRGVLLSLIQTVPNDWTFRDVLLALRFEERLRQLLEKTLEGRGILDQFFRTGSETVQGVRATIATRIAPYEVIAAAWDRATEKVSLKEFMAGNFVLVLGNDEETRTALDAINRVLFKRLSELILAGRETRSKQTWIFLDEVREAGNLEGLSRLMTKGRSKGACVALGFQAIEGMREVYGNNVAGEITGLCNNKAILRLESPESARWASELFGKAEIIDRRGSISRSQNIHQVLPGRSRAVSEQRLITDAVMASEIMTLPPAGPENGLQGYFITRAKGAYRKTVPWCKMGLNSKAGEVSCSNFLPRSGESQYLRDWCAGDYSRLGLNSLCLVEANDAFSTGDPRIQGEYFRRLRSSRAS